MASSNKRLSCGDYHVAWICPLSDLELLPARLMLDEEHPTPPYDTHYDENTYICGTINRHAVVVATCPKGDTGNVNAGRLTGSMFKTFPNIRMAVLVGIGGGIPQLDTISEDPLENVHLGDVVVGWPGDGKPACVYHDRGKSMADGNFEMVGTMQNPDWRLTNALSILASDHELGMTRFEDQLARLQRHKIKKRFAHPGLDHDKLFKAAYHHIGDNKSECTACDRSKLVQRPQRTEEHQHILTFHQGRIATGNAVIKDGKLRDEISARCNGALCVEMEAAGVDANRRCLVVRGISDYADSHKSDVWKSYAAGNAAAFTRELLCRVQASTVKEMEGVSEAAPWLVPLPRPQSFVGREAQLAQLRTHISSEYGHRLVIYGLGGCGKTALVLEAAFRSRSQHPARAIFWVPAVSHASFEQSYREIGMLLRIPIDAKTDVKELVKTKLSDEKSGQWLMIVDNADDLNVLYGLPDEGNDVNRLIDYLPRSRKGSVVFTTRTRKAAIDLAENNAIELGEMSHLEAKELLKTHLLLKHQHQVEDEAIVTEFLSLLTFFALAIVQAAAFINKNGSTLSEYVLLYKSNEQNANQLLSREFEDPGRYRETKNPVATTWYISFEQIKRYDKLAADQMSFIACMASNDIPESLLPIVGSQVEQLEAIGTLKAYAFITDRQSQRDWQQGQEAHSRGPKAFDVHPLVHFAMRNWLKAHGQWITWAEKSLERLKEAVPFGGFKTKETWTRYLSHATCLADIKEVSETDARLSLLDRVGFCELTLGRYKGSERAYRQVLELREGKLGKENLDTLGNMNNLGIALSYQGMYTQAERIHQETLALYKKVLGKEHPYTLVIMNNLGREFSNLEKYTEAEQMHQDTLALKKKIFGKEHPTTLLSMNNLAIALRGQGKYAEAEQMHQETLVLRKKVLGDDHPDTLESLNNLAFALSFQQQHAKAEQMHKETLELYEKVLGREHPKTLTSMNNLGYALFDQGKLVDAIFMMQKCAERREEYLGPEHTDTLKSLEILDEWRVEAQKRDIELM